MEDHKAVAPNKLFQEIFFLFVKLSLKNVFLSRTAVTGKKLWMQESLHSVDSESLGLRTWQLKISSFQEWD